MARTFQQTASFLRYLVRSGSRNRQDATASEQTSWSNESGGLPAGLELQWLGTSGFRLSYEGHTVLIDPYLSRLPLGDVLKRRVRGPDLETIDAHLDAADAVLIGHTHFDHALDAPAIAERFDCKVYGSPSMANLMALYGLEHRAVEVEHYRVYEVGPFAITFVPSIHSRLVLGLKIPYDYDITCEHLDGMTAQAYGCGQVYGIHIEVAGISFYHQGSADLIEDAIRHRNVDYFLAGIAGRGFTSRYTERILRAIEPRVVIPNHYDDFFRPLDEPMRFSFNVNYTGFLHEVTSVSQDFEIRSLEVLQTVSRE
jgi:L-ascorbate metabolism protein UlaG (beta-lactamase superfamily)